jgi:hypothetical protein
MFDNTELDEKNVTICVNRIAKSVARLTQVYSIVNTIFSHIFVRNSHAG